MTGTVPLAEGFAAANRSEWLERAAAVLAKRRGPVATEDVAELLATVTEDGFALDPLSGREPAGEPAWPGTGNRVRGADPDLRPGWAITARHWAGGELASTPADVADDGGNGVTDLWVTVDETDALSALLADVDLTRTPVVVEGFGDPRTPRTLVELLDGRTAPATTSLGLDPFGTLAATGLLPDQAAVADLARAARARGVRGFAIDGTLYHDAGASAGEEIGAATAAGVATLRLLADAGLSAQDAAALLEFRFAVTDDQFESLAKLRAARVVWARVLAVAGVGDRGQAQHAVTSAAMLTQRDPWVNLVRNCVAAFAAGAGGAQRVTVLPHTQALGAVDAFARRMARNTQHLILLESFAGVVTDPGGGSHHVEARTAQTASVAWDWFTEIERAGGFAAAAEGLLAERMAATQADRQRRLATRRQPVTGVSEFPDATRSVALTHPWRRPGEGLPQHRRAEAFEALRDRADAVEAQPRIALLALGSRAAYGPRETWARNLFGVAGIATEVVPVSPGVPVALPEGVTVACVVGADPDYESSAATTAAAARQAGADRIMLAGRPGDRAASDAAAGITHHVYAGCDVLAVLTDTLDHVTAGEAT